MNSAFSIISGLAVLIVSLSVVTAFSGVLAVCGIHAFSFPAFLADGQCQASDQPREVFESFAILGFIAGDAVSAVWGLYRFFLALFEKGHP